MVLMIAAVTGTDQAAGRARVKVCEASDDRIILSDEADRAQRCGMRLKRIPCQTADNQIFECRYVGFVKGSNFARVQPLWRNPASCEGASFAQAFICGSGWAKMNQKSRLLVPP